MTTTVTTVTTTTTSMASTTNSNEGGGKRRTTLLRVEGIDALGQLPFMLQKSAIGHHSGVLLSSRPSTPGTMTPSLMSGACTPFREMPQLKVLRSYDTKDPTDRALAFAIGARMKMLKKNNLNSGPHSPFLKAPGSFALHSRTPLRMEFTPALASPRGHPTSYFDSDIITNYSQSGTPDERVSVFVSTPGSPWSAVASAGHTPGSILMEMDVPGNEVEPSFLVTENSFSGSSSCSSPLVTPDSSLDSVTLGHEAEEDIVDPWIAVRLHSLDQTQV